MRNLTTGQLAKATGVNIETIRYYERHGLILEPNRRESGYRVFTPDYVERIRFIKRAQTLGLALREISELLDLADGNPACKDIRKYAENKIEDIENRIRDLKKNTRCAERLGEKVPKRKKTIRLSHY